MHPIIESIENDDFTKFNELLNEHPEYLNELDPDGWGLLFLVTKYDMSEFASVLLEKMDSTQINSQTPYHPLHLAFENKSTLVDLFINNPKIDLNVLSKSGDNLLYYADYFERSDLSPQLISSGISPFTENKLERSPILHAIEKGKIELFDLYMKDPDASSQYLESWIKKAIKHDQLNIFKRLHPYSNLSSDDLFNLALGFEHVKIANAVLDTGDLIPGQAQITKLIDMMCKTYEDEESVNASLNIADFLFEIKVPFSRFVNAEGQSAWMLAVENDNEVIFDKLVHSNETVNITDDRQNTPLFYAIEKRNLEFVKHILKKGGSVSHVDRNKNTPLHQAVRYGLDEIVTELLRYPNAGVNEANNAKQTPLSLAVDMKRMKSVTPLIWAGGEITKNPTKFIEDNSVFQIGLNGQYEKAFDNSEEKQIDSFIALSKLGFNLNQINEKGDSFLLHFIKNGYLANFKTLLKCSLDPNAVDSEGNTALMCAMKKNNDEYALGLLWKFANIDFNHINNAGETVYDLAAECNSAKRASFLIRKDHEITKENIQKLLPIISLSGSLEEVHDNINEQSIKLDKELDKFNNNLLMLAALGNNIDNFKWLITQPKLKFNVSDVNKKSENIIDIINKLGSEDSIPFTEALSTHLVSSKKTPK